ncbi:hypothetical protein HYU10_03730 [Candidatus Woesearchaeota archaeon]|nr:hypothetical protein [Candidatus Woesearchaeota archaeon]MBI2130853.1 hypothetical protein [Candidatus Woesearchaeota archaeon]MBI2661715.1 hypothetical protein [Candidatus Woesearchaeota archaeon]
MSSNKNKSGGKPATIVQYAGFTDIDGSSLALVRKSIDTHHRKLEEHGKSIELVKITLKDVHKKEKGEIYELHCYVIDNGKKYAAETTDRNLLAGVDAVFNKVLKEIISNKGNLRGTVRPAV